MKIKPAKLLMALLLGLSCTTFVSTAAFADSDKDKADKEAKDKSDKDKSDKDSKDKADKASESVTGTTSSVVNACGLTIIKTTHASTVSTSTKYEEEDDDKHESKAKDAKDKNDYDYAEEGHKDHLDRSTGANKEGDGKISICHRMGGAEVSLTVANDGWLNGHSKHALDTIGRCSDFDDKTKASDKDTDTKISASDTGYNAELTPTQVDCLAKPTEEGGAGCNTATTTCTIPPPGQNPSRGGARTLH